MTTTTLATALQNSDLLFDRQQLLQAIAAMGGAIDSAYQGAAQPPVFLTVMNGGLILAGHLALACKTDFLFDYIHATRYRSSTQGFDLEWVSTPRTAIAGREVLVVDDIFDEGRTLAAIVAWCKERGAARVRLAVLCEKAHQRRVPKLKADFLGVTVPDRYVYGFGMDFEEQGRNLDGIYALKEA